MRYRPVAVQIVGGAGVLWLFGVFCVYGCIGAYGKSPAGEIERGRGVFGRARIVPHREHEGTVCGKHLFQYARPVGDDHAGGRRGAAHGGRRPKGQDVVAQGDEPVGQSQIIVNRRVAGQGLDAAAFYGGFVVVLAIHSLIRAIKGDRTLSFCQGSQGGAGGRKAQGPVVGACVRIERHLSQGREGPV